MDFAIESLALRGIIACPADRYECLVVVGNPCREAAERSRKASAGAAGRRGGGLVQVGGTCSVLESCRRRYRTRSGEGARQGCPCRAHSIRSAGGRHCCCGFFTPGTAAGCPSFVVSNSNRLKSPVTATRRPGKNDTLCRARPLFRACGITARAGNVRSGSI